MADREPTVEFGASEKFGSHHFRVEVPTGSTEDVHIVEDYGYQGGEGDVPHEEERAIIPRAAWRAISDAARREFNDRLKTTGMEPGRWHSGANKVDRILGKELCVLAWATEKADPDKYPVVATRWAALRPEERWWLFNVTVAEAGLAEDSDRGWRKALRYALSDGDAPPPGKRRRRPKPVQENLFSLPIFENS